MDKGEGAPIEGSTKGLLVKRGDLKRGVVAAAEALIAAKDSGGPRFARRVWKHMGEPKWTTYASVRRTININKLNPSPGSPGGKD